MTFCSEDEPNPVTELERRWKEEKARADRAEQENKRLKAWCGRLGAALVGVQDAMRNNLVPTPHLDSVLSELAASMQEERKDV